MSASDAQPAARTPAITPSRLVASALPLMAARMALLLGLVVGVLALPFAASPLLAQGGDRGGGLRDLPTVTIITDGLDATSPASLAIAQLARRLADERSVRVLAIAGRGAADNVHDLLYFRGVDFAILNSDVFALPDLGPELQDARRRIRMVSPLYDRKVYLLARGGISRLEDLRGRAIAAVGTEAGGYTTARAILSIEGIRANIQRLAPATPLDAANLANYDAVLLVGEEITRLKPQGSGLRLIPIAFSQPLAVAYKAGAVTSDELGELTGGQVVPTLERTTLLATFNWSQVHSRFPAIRTFLQAYFTALPQLRETEGSIWRQSNVTAAVAALTPHPLAVATRFLQPDQVVALSRAEPVMLRPQSAPAAVPAGAPVAQAPPLVAAAAATAPASVPAAAPALVPAPQAVTVAPPATTVAPTAGPTPPASTAVTPARAQPLPSGTPSDTRVGTAGAGTGNDARKVQAAIAVRPPLADPKDDSGGLALDLLARALKAGAEPGLPPPTLSPAWSNRQEPTAGTFGEGATHQLSGPWIGIDCEQPNSLAGSASMLCDEAQLSEPLLRVAFSLHAMTGKAVSFETPQAREGRTVCLTRDTDGTLLSTGGRAWSADKGFTIQRRASLVECVAAVQAQEADAFLAIDFEGQDVLNRLGLTGQISQVGPPVGTRGVHVAASRNQAEGMALLTAINRGIQALRGQDSYAAAINQHLQPYWQLAQKGR